MQKQKVFKENPAMITLVT
ncbi:hypothetical protein F383_35234 [Gossypium arboreum]|uniref:Uncharacterized protein n=1 Tax=Gossypium arboreum TaxID=29729 RepID=A0A0B0NA72_GOSAR|nr:hypothetical protein F383_35234 [Gossypium arboreum]